MNGTLPGREERGSLAYLVAICLVATVGGLIFGYDTGVISGAIEFLEKHFQLTPFWKGAASSCVLIGCMIGVSFAGMASDRLGRKMTMMIAGAVFLISSIGTAIPQSLAVFIVFRILAGVGIGFASITSPMYIAEIAPARIRGRMVSVNQFAIVSGFLVIFFVNYAIARQGDEAWKTAMSWRWMFASGAIPSVLFLGLLLAVPESPRWLVEQGRKEQASGILRRIGGSGAAASEMAAIEASLAADEARPSFREVFRPALRPILWMAIALAVLQQVTGINAFLYFGPSIFESVGKAVNVDAALLENVVVGAVNMLFTVLAIWTVDRLGRKPLMVIGSAGMGVCLLAMALAAQFQVAGALWILVFILGYIACFALSVGPVTWVILSEVFPTAIRGRALGIATLCLWFADFLVTQTYPMMEDKDGWLVANFHHAFPFYIYAAFCAVLLVVMIRYVPETKGKTLEEIEASWKGGRAAEGAGEPAAR